MAIATRSLEFAPVIITNSRTFELELLLEGDLILYPISMTAYGLVWIGSIRPIDIGIGSVSPREDSKSTKESILIRCVLAVRNDNLPLALYVIIVKFSSTSKQSTLETDSPLVVLIKTKVRR